MNILNNFFLEKKPESSYEILRQKDIIASTINLRPSNVSIDVSFGYIAPTYGFFTYKGTFPSTSTALVTLQCGPLLHTACGVSTILYTFFPTFPGYSISMPYLRTGITTSYLKFIYAEGYEPN